MTASLIHNLKSDFHDSEHDFLHQIEVIDKATMVEIKQILKLKFRFYQEVIQRDQYSDCEKIKDFITLIERHFENNRVRIMGDLVAMNRETIFIIERIDSSADVLMTLRDRETAMDSICFGILLSHKKKCQKLVETLEQLDSIATN